MELPKWLVDWAQLLGAGLSLLALVLALYALNKSKRDLAEERRHAHELDILRDIGNVIEEHPSLDQVRRLRTQLLMLPSEDLPTVRAAVEANPSFDAMVVFRVRYAANLASRSGSDVDEQRMRRLELIRREGIDRDELDMAVTKRLQP